MRLFSSPLSYLGVDIGHSVIKIVELRNEKGKPKLVTYGFGEHHINLIDDSLGKAQNEIASLIKEICQKSKTTTTKAITALPNFSVFSSIITLPSVSKKDLEAAIRWEAKKLIPLSLEEMVLDWKIINKEKDQRNIKVLLTGASRQLVQKYLDIFKMAGLNLLSLETESFALIRSLVGNDPSSLMITNMGARSTDIFIVEKGLPVLNRSIEVGGNLLTSALAQALSLSLKEAEQFKHDIGIIIDVSNQGPTVIEETITPIINEIKYIKNLYLNRSLEGSKENIEKLILAGGGARLPNLVPYLSNLLQMKVYIGDPWSYVIYPLDLKPVLDSIAPQFAVPIGLAMRDIE